MNTQMEEMSKARSVGMGADLLYPVQVCCSPSTFKGFRSPVSGVGGKGQYTFLITHHTYIKYLRLHFLFHQLPLDSLPGKMRVTPKR